MSRAVWKGPYNKEWYQEIKPVLESNLVYFDLFKALNVKGFNKFTQSCEAQHAEHSHPYGARSVLEGASHLCSASFKSAVYASRFDFTQGVSSKNQQNHSKTPMGLHHWHSAVPSEIRGVLKNRWGPKPFSSLLNKKDRRNETRPEGLSLKGFSHLVYLSLYNKKGGHFYLTNLNLNDFYYYFFLLDLKESSTFICPRGRFAALRAVDSPESACFTYNGQNNALQAESSSLNQSSLGRCFANSQSVFAKQIQLGYFNMYSNSFSRDILPSAGLPLDLQRAQLTSEEHRRTKHAEHQLLSSSFNVECNSSINQLNDEAQNALRPLNEQFSQYKEYLKTCGPNASYFFLKEFYFFLSKMGASHICEANRKTRSAPSRAAKAPEGGGQHEPNDRGSEKETTHANGPRSGYLTSIKGFADLEKDAQRVDIQSRIAFKMNAERPTNAQHPTDFYFHPLIAHFHEASASSTWVESYRRKTGIPFFTISEYYQNFRSFYLKQSIHSDFSLIDQRDNSQETSFVVTNSFRGFLKEMFKNAPQQFLLDTLTFSKFLLKTREIDSSDTRNFAHGHIAATQTKTGRVGTSNPRTNNLNTQHSFGFEDLQRLIAKQNAERPQTQNALRLEGDHEFSSLAQKAPKGSQKQNSQKYFRFSRRSTVLPEFVGLNVGVHDGRDWKTFQILDKHVGFKFGDFVFTKKPAVYKRNSKSQKGLRRKTAMRV